VAIERIGGGFLLDARLKRGLTPTLLDAHLQEISRYHRGLDIAHHQFAPPFLTACGSTE
jgi:hypothetical protein